MSEESHTTAPPQQTHNTHHHTHNVDQQLVIGADDNKRINIIGHLNVLHRGLPEPVGRWARRFFYMHQDTCANCVVVGSDAARACMKNVRAAHPDDHILMNSHPARVMLYGDLCVELFDERTHTWVEVTIANAAYVPESRFDLLGFSAYQKQLWPGAEMVFRDNVCILPVTKERRITGKKRGGLFSMRGRRPQRPSHTHTTSTHKVQNGKVRVRSVAVTHTDVFLTHTHTGGSCRTGR